MFMQPYTVEGEIIITDPCPGSNVVVTATPQTQPDAYFYTGDLLQFQLQPF